jgi:adenylate kinase family enzyme
MKLKIPSKEFTGSDLELESSLPLVFIGANGSGKSKLGSWIEDNNANVHRISAQKFLAIPDYAPLLYIEQAQNFVTQGHAATGQQRWTQGKTTSLLNDFSYVISLLFAHENKRNADYFDATKTNKDLPHPKSPIDILVEIWQSIIPYREIEFREGKVFTRSPYVTDRYHGKEMSDGERVALYLLGQSLCAPENSILVIDEPEIHLHKALMNELWSEIEKHRPDCLFVYLTHDLEFASTRVGSKILWVKEFNGSKWNWVCVPEVDNLPSNLLLEIVGSRKPILFTEGEKGSLDFLIYKEVYPGFHVVPRGGSLKVVESAKAISENKALHNIKAYGLIDRDFKTDEEINALKKQGILFVDVAEVENLFCVREVLKLVSKKLDLDPAKKVEEATDFLIKTLKEVKESQISERTTKEIQFRLGAYNKKAKGKTEINNALGELFLSIKAEELYRENTKLFNNAIKSKDLELLLRIFNRKNLVTRISGLFGLKDGEYEDLIIRMIQSGSKNQVVSALKKYLPSLPLPRKKRLTKVKKR